MHLGHHFFDFWLKVHELKKVEKSENQGLRSKFLSYSAWIWFSVEDSGWFWSGLRRSIKKNGKEILWIDVEVVLHRKFFLVSIQSWFSKYNQVTFCVHNFCGYFTMWIINVRSVEALDCVEVCFYFGGNFSVLVVDGLVWNDGVSLLVLAILSLQVDCGYFEKSFGEFGMCLSAYLTNDVIFLIFWTVGCLLMSRLFIARFSACFVWILLKWHLWWWGVAVTCDLTWCLCKTVQN